MRMYTVGSIGSDGTWTVVTIAMTNNAQASKREKGP